MPYDLTHLETYLEDAEPSEIACLLDEVLYDLVLSAAYTDNHESLREKYLDIMLLRNQFALMDDQLCRVWK